MADEAARNAGAERVSAVHVDVGTMAGIVPEALEFSFEIAAQQTLLEGATLVIRTIPLAIFCAVCAQEVEPSGPLNVRCPICQTPSADIRRGRELDLVSLEIVETALVTE